MTRPNRRKPDFTSWSTGEWGVNRVQLYVHRKSRRLYLRWYKVLGGTRVSRTRALGHSNISLGKAQAEELAAQLRTPASDHDAAPITLRELFDIYAAEVTVRKAPSTRDHDYRAMALFLKLWGPERAAASLNRRDWEKYIAERRSGRLAPPDGSGKPVRNRVVQQDLTLLRSILNWATESGNESGQMFLNRNPLAGLTIPAEENPSRPLITEGEFERLLAVAPTISPRFYLALVLCNETGHRLNSVRQLRWDDVDLQGSTIHWRPENDKSKHDHVTVITETAGKALQDERQRQVASVPFNGTTPTWIFQSEERHAPIGRRMFYRWWSRARIAAELPAVSGRAFHAFRRKLATELALQPLALVKDIGGWKNPSVPLRFYQFPTLAQQREVMAARDAMRRSGTEKCDTFCDTDATGKSIARRA